ncbi:hypothetical protein [Bacillus cereus]|uniref:hypothetical protein n=1 Tax=Bacillus cereus TaxID=1396 RepID=UPI000365A054|nr:hypothetical protein [Bacillus cereus]MCU4733625.1 hypothetical protein [Bacillus cereus]MCU5149243.1 hypothetical protein [Bacillus cereus]MCU5496243.1 hypothetical protein [Bacillus cereus]MCU5640951.1 hypothetical protein [Bacillus cereus]MCU5702241.1 hypothetical protein [Bacillus cereus]
MSTKGYKLSYVGILAAILGLIITLIAQLFAIIDDSYTFGNIWFLGVLSSVVGLIGSLLIYKNKNMGILILSISIVLGVISISYLYLIPAILQLICIFKVSKQYK